MEEQLEKKLSEKFTYLFKSHFLNKFDLFKLEVEDLEIKDDKIKELSITFDCDYFGACHGDPQDVSHMLNQVDHLLSDFIYKYPVNPMTKRFDPKFEDFQVQEGLVLEFNYKFDELHRIIIDYRIDYEN